MSKHTSGPWRIRYGGMPGDDGFGIEACNAIQSHVAMVAECWPCNVTGNEHREELAANARLIAAAPALLAAAKAALADYETINAAARIVGSGIHPFTIVPEELAAAIKLADGEE